MTSMETGAPLLKQWGHSGVSLTHYCFDRQPYASLVPLVHARHECYHAEAVGGLPHAADLDWVMTTACAAHDCSNAIKWSVQSEVTEANQMKDLFKATRSLRDSNVALHAVVPEFVMRSVRRHRGGRGPEAARSWWATLGFEPYWVDALVDADLV